MQWWELFSSWFCGGCVSVCIRLVGCRRLCKFLECYVCRSCLCFFCRYSLPFAIFRNVFFLACETKSKLEKRKQVDHRGYGNHIGIALPFLPFFCFQKILKCQIVWVCVPKRRNKNQKCNQTSSLPLIIRCHSRIMLWNTSFYVIIITWNKSFIFFLMEKKRWGGQDRH